MEDKIVKLLLSLGVPPCLKGFRASVYAIEMILKDPSVLDQITKRLYPNIAKRLGSTASCVERQIRTAVDTMFDHHDYENIVGTLGLDVNMRTGKYTNSEFLSLCTLKLRMDGERRNDERL